MISITLSAVICVHFGLTPTISSGAEAMREDLWFWVTWVVVFLVFVSLVVAIALSGASFSTSTTITIPIPTTTVTQTVTR